MLIGPLNDVVTAHQKVGVKQLILLGDVKSRLNQLNLIDSFLPRSD